MLIKGDQIRLYLFYLPFIFIEIYFCRLHHVHNMCYLVGIRSALFRDIKSRSIKNNIDGGDDIPISISHACLSFLSEIVHHFSASREKCQAEHDAWSSEYGFVFPFSLVNIFHIFFG